MEIHSLYRDNVKDETSIVLEVAKFMSLDKLVETEFKVPFERSLKWRLKILAVGTKFSVFLTNPKHAKNNVHARLRTVLVDGDGEETAEEKSIPRLVDYSNLEPGEGRKVTFNKKTVEPLLVEGSLMIKCVVCVAKGIKFNIKSFSPIECAIQFNCIIENFMRSGDLISDVIVTPFDEQLRWKVKIYPNGEYKNGCTCVTVCRANKENEEKVLSECSILDAKDKVVFSQKLDLGVVFERGTCLYTSKDFVQKFLINGNLRLQLMIDYKEYYI